MTMTKRMLIDATHPEETRVAVVSGNKLEEYDYENVLRKQLKSNIYLVKVTRVEPSLQAAFVDFGGNRHGFLPFPEIHPDYYRIPVADRQALIAEERAIAAAQAAKEDEEDEAELARLGETDEDDFDDEESEEDDEDEEDEEDSYTPQHTGSIAAEIEREILIDDEDEEDEEESETAEAAEDEDENEDDAEESAAEETTGSDTAAAVEAAEKQDAEAGVDTLDNDDPVEETPVFRSAIKRRYKIQEVVKRNQIMLIQINKEERGNKGAAVTSYISLPGRYCVLMPNSPRGGGVSRKVSNAKDRQRLKKILQELNVPEGMSVILRTAGVSRSKAEIKRDLDYLLRLWDQIRELTLKSTAPALIYEEGNLVKRAIRDLYRREIDEVHVAGEEGYKTAKEFMRTLMPSHATRVQPYKDDSIPLFFRYQVESQIDEIHTPTVHLKSGGYIVINPTEALVSIDVNSGRATKGRHIEETALKTNLEAAEEIARQLRLRDQGGLVVIDFIDMEDRRNNRLVERKMRDAMAGDRSRIQIGRISPFGLMELSRQRLHPSLVETNFEICKHCSGVGVVRTVETTAVMVLRAIEEEGLRGRALEIRVSVPTEIALYIFNNKREMLTDIEKRYGIKIFIHADDKLIKPAYAIDVVRGSNQPRVQQRQQLAPVKSVDMSDLEDIDPEDITDDSTVAEEDDEEGGDNSDNRNRRNSSDRGDRNDRSGDRNNERNDRNDRRRGRRGGRNRPRDRDQTRDGNSNVAQKDGDSEQTAVPPAAQARSGNDRDNNAPTNDGNDRNGRRRRRRGRRGGRDRGPRQEGGRAPQEGDGGNRAAAENSNGDRNRDSRDNNDKPRDNSAPRASTQQENRPPMTSAANGTEGGGSNKPSRKGWWKRLTE
jgi:ribonuclease E